MFAESSFGVFDARALLTCAIMLLVALVIRNLVERIRRQAEAARRREALTNKLYAMSQELVAAGSIDAVIATAKRHLSEAFHADVAIALPDSDGRLTPSLVSQCAAPSEIVRSVPLLASMGAVGVLWVLPRHAHALERDEAEKLLETFASPVALALERGRLAEQAQRTQVQVETEKLRNALLSSVSHDLRTPLAVVQGAATELLDRAEMHSLGRRREFLQTIATETRRLNRLVNNLLQMTALEAGVLSAKKEWQPIDEVIGVALGRLEDQLRDRPLEAGVPDGLPLVAIDGTLIEQVLVNLIENANKYAPAGAPITVEARQAREGLEVLVLDRGPGIARGEEERIFDKFYRALKSEQGMGLGLTICRGIVAAHGGTIRAENRAGGGAAVRFTLPLAASASSAGPYQPTSKPSVVPSAWETRSRSTQSYVGSIQSPTRAEGQNMKSNATSAPTNVLPPKTCTISGPTPTINSTPRAKRNGFFNNSSNGASTPPSAANSEAANSNSSQSRMATHSTNRFAPACSAPPAGSISCASPIPTTTVCSMSISPSPRRGGSRA
jgi:two-component system sensor histidine kinase KdpD